MATRRGERLMELAVFRENRSKFSLVQLAGHQGEWVAFSLDGRRIIASSPDLGMLDKLVIEAGEDPEQVAFERIEPEDVSLGGAELG